MSDLSPAQLRLLHAIKRGAAIAPIRPDDDECGIPLGFERAVRDGGGWRFKSVRSDTVYALERKGLIRIPSTGNLHIEVTDVGQKVAT